MKKLLTGFAGAVALLACVCANAQAPAKGLLVLDDQDYRRLEEAPRATRGPLPSSATLERMFPEPRNQGNFGSCTAWATSYAKAYRIYKAGDQVKAPDAHLQSPAYIYSALTRQQCNSGTYIHEALQFMRLRGSVPWDALPYSDQSCPNWQSARPAASNHSTHAYRLGFAPAVALQQIKEAVADGTPVILAINACSEFTAPANGFIDAVNSNDSCGAHAVLAVGYSDDRKAVRILNSWGPDWGDKGKVWMSYRAFERRFIQAYVDFGPQDNQLVGPWSQWLEPVPDARVSAVPSGPANPEAATVAVATSLKVSESTLVRSLRSNISSKSLGMAVISGEKKPVSKWSLWLNLPKADAVQVESVEYYFNHPSFINPKRSIPGSSIFMTEWTGHGCVHDAYLVAKLKDKTRIRANFNFCAVLAKSLLEEQPVPVLPTAAVVPTGFQDNDFQKFLTRFLTDPEFAKQNSAEQIQVFEIKRYRGVVKFNGAGTITPEDAISRSRKGVVNLAPSAANFTVARTEGYYVCLNGTPVEAECPGRANAMHFSEKSGGGWAFTATYGP